MKTRAVKLGVVPEMSRRTRRSSPQPSARVVPGRLQATGFAFRDSTLEGALRRLLAL